MAHRCCDVYGTVGLFYFRSMPSRGRNDFCRLGREKDASTETSLWMDTLGAAVGNFYFATPLPQRIRNITELLRRVRSWLFRAKRPHGLKLDGTTPLPCVGLSERCNGWNMGI